MFTKLEQIGISDAVLTLFNSYFSNRKQCFVIDGVKSSMMYIQAGVPQGSRLGSLLFIIYINDIVEGLESEILIFADAVLTLFNSYLSNRKQCVVVDGVKSSMMDIQSGVP